MENSNREKAIQDYLIAKFKDQTSITVLIQDLEQTSNLMDSEVEKKLVSRIMKVLNDSYLNRERYIMTKFAFDFYSDFSRQMGVPENRISENFTHIEIYFEEKFNQNKDV
jgi:hypothetical protein